MNWQTGSTGGKMSNKEIMGLVLASGLVFLLYAWFSWNTPWRFNSPDEAANAFWSDRLSQGQSLKVPSPLSQIAGSGVVHPRSLRVENDYLQPVSFLGLPVAAGSLSYFLGRGFLPYVTPLLAALGLIAWYYILRQLFDRRTAVIGFLLLALLPASWYYGSRSFFHNSGFFSLLLIAWAVNLKALREKSLLWWCLSGLVGGLAVAFRSSEIFWLLLAASLWFYSYRQQISWRFLMAWLIGGLIGFCPVIAANLAIYGRPLSIAYQTDGLKNAVSLGSAASLLKQLIMPFGWHPKIILNTVGNYLVALHWWWFILVVGGWLWLGRNLRKFRPEQKNVFIVIIAISFWLVFLYGSWLFNDNPDPQAVTIGTSYVRYWLPIYALALWPSALALSKLSYGRYGRYMVIGLLVFYSVWSAYAVMWSEPEGLLRIKNNIKYFETVSQEVQQLTPKNSLIVSGKTDKFFWPERQVIIDLANDQDYLSVVNLLQAGFKVYQFHPTWPAGIIKELNDKRLKEYNLQIKTVRDGWQGFSLYQLDLFKYE